MAKDSFMRVACFWILVLGLVRLGISFGAKEIRKDWGGGRANGPCLIPRAGSLGERRLKFQGSSCHEDIGASSGGLGRVKVGSQEAARQDIESCCSDDCEEKAHKDETCIHHECSSLHQHRPKHGYAGLRCRLVMCDAIRNSGHRRMQLRGGSDIDADQRMTGKRQRLR
jgi:hypothetical protein